MAEHMLTTVDNPFNPFTAFDDWYAFDTLNGYYTLALLGRVVATSDDLSEADQASAIEQAIDEIVEFNVSGMHRKVRKEEGETGRGEGSRKTATPSASVAS
jgi:hypothetical protein